MPVNSVNLMDVMKQKQLTNVNKEEKKEILNTAAPKTPVDENKKSKLPYVAGAVVLAALGVWGGKKLYKSFKNNPVTEKVNREVKENAEKIEEKVVTEVKERVTKVEEAIKENIEKVKEKVAPQKAVSSEQRPEISNLIESAQNNKAEKAQGLTSITDALEKAAAKREDFYAMYDFGKGGEGLSIIEENTHNGFVDVPTLEKVARDFIADKNRANSAMQASSLLEETYTRAYDNIINNYAVGGLGDIYNRITKESTALFEVYEKMPLNEALFRIFNFSKRKLGSDSLTRIGMSAEEFRAKTVAAYKEYLKTAHK